MNYPVFLRGLSTNRNIRKIANLYNTRDPVMDIPAAWSISMRLTCITIFHDLLHMYLTLRSFHINLKNDCLFLYDCQYIFKLNNLNKNILTGIIKYTVSFTPRCTDNTKSCRWIIPHYSFFCFENRKPGSANTYMNFHPDNFSSQCSGLSFLHIYGQCQTTKEEGGNFFVC